MQLTAVQQQAAAASFRSRTFVRGPAGCGKTTAAAARLRALLDGGIPGASVLVLTPQRSLQEPYLEVINSPDVAAGGPVFPVTVGGLARRMVDLYWPLAAKAAGFAHPDRPPVFLTLETAQYYMARIVRPMLEQGSFDSVTIDRNRLYSQILDNLNKAASVGFPAAEIGARLDSAYFGDPAQRRVYADVQECADRPRRYCLEHNLLDFSLQLEVFWDILWPDALVHECLARNYRHLVYDNLEEDIPRAHDLLRLWLPEFDSALLIYDEEGGFRRFLGADVESGLALKDLCENEIPFEESFISSPAVDNLRQRLAKSILPDPAPPAESIADPGEALQVLQYRFYPQLLDSVAAETARLVAGGLPPSEIAILAPYLSDALRFSIAHRLESLSVPWRSHRPSRALRDEPACQALLTLACLAHPQWEVHPPRFDLAYALVQSIGGLDLVRAQLLAEIVYRPRELGLAPFDGIRPEVQERITYLLGNRYSLLRAWLLDYRQAPPLPLDHFLRKMFGEVLSQPGFAFHDSFDPVRVAASLVESVRKFRQALEPAGNPDTGREYLAMLQDGVIAASYVESWRSDEKEAALVAPAYTFLMMNRPATVQFWLDPGSGGWYERLSQPLTHPYVLSREWERHEPGRVWGDADELAAGRLALGRLACGLLRRCRERLYLGIAELGESGFEQRGELLRVFQKVTRT